jgi:hypothetical protein
LGVDERVDEPSAPHKASVLSCPRCTTPCPLGFGESAECVRCHQVIALSEAQRERRDRQRRHDAERRQKDELWQLALNSRPHFFQQPMFLAALSYVAPFLAALGAYYFGYRENDYGRAGLVWLLGIGALHFISSTLLLHRKPQMLRDLLTARAPDEPGEPPRCRVCAAPLSIEPPPARPRDCSCDHCGADNILGSPPKGTPRPDLYGSQAAYRQVFGDPVSQRAARLYPFTLLMGFVALGVLSYYAIHAPIKPLQ